MYSGQTIDFTKRQSCNLGYQVCRERLGFHGSCDIKSFLSTTLSTTFSTLREDVVAQDHDIIQMPIISVQFILGHTVQFQTFLYFL